ncbi:MAG: type II secretion system protein [Verrucomicrobia bacterium]|nr:type II secretion system protein [Verrucomicrobiota bacterium]
MNRGCSGLRSTAGLRKQAHRRAQRAFTLVELLAVIAIIAMLAGLLSPVIRQAVGRARSAQCTSQLRQLGHAIQLYAQENNQKFPTVEPLPSLPVDPDHPLPSLHEALLKYVQGDEMVFRCPRDAKRWPVEGASYEWCYPYGDDLVDAPKVWIFNRPIEKATLLWDYDNVHADQGGTHTKNILFADGHVSGI